jgi:hypothetical protein
MPLADYKVVSEGLGITFQPTHPKTLLKSVMKTPSLTHLIFHMILIFVTSVTCFTKVTSMNLQQCDTVTQCDTKDFKKP